MLSRLISGGEESDFILLTCPSSSSPADILKQFLKTCSAGSVLVSTGPNQILPAGDNFSKVIELKDFLGWNSGIPLKFPDCVLKEVDPGKEAIVIDSLTDLLVFQKPTAVANLIRKLKQKSSNKAKLFAVLHKECLDDNIAEAVEQLATTTIVMEKLDETEAYPQMCRISHRKLGGKLVTSKEVIKLDVLGNIKIEPFTENKVKSKYIEEDDADEAIDKLTTFNIGTSKNKEKEAKEKLVLPFYTDEQKQSVVTAAGEVKIQGEVPGKIYYEPDSGDDWDDDDPDDDLDF
eukprot:TRINITY_DN14158_c0_g1_i1.p1 TRINITY_DN14158_c0_g1~~TRINITY_DN14158_c0_g1_i1.p1  ORF type:complete len:290 (+),score=111.27 TRINITY_DN14158_c0_g1_i1:56-925(+)